jgi:hypothetical protein
MATEVTNGAPAVLLVESSSPEHHHAELLRRAGLHVMRLPLEQATSHRIQELNPAIIAVEFDGSRPSDALDLVPRLHGDARSDPTRTTGERAARYIPVIVYGHGLSAPDIESAARGGAMWLQLEPSDGVKLVAAIRGVLTAGGIQIKNL